MALLSVSNLQLSFGTRRILDGVNLTLSEGEHIGLIGRNGCGKSTLLKVIAHREAHKPDAGQVQIARGITVGYLSQHPDLNPDLTLREEAARAFERLTRLQEHLEKLAHDMATAQGDALDKLLKQYEEAEKQLAAAGGYAVDHQIDATLHGVGLSEKHYDVKVSALSGGQKGRLALAKLLLSQPEVLLMDEPTNHLDIAARQWLEEYLIQYRGAVILVSHDRWLLDRVVSKIYEMHAGRLEEYPGNYQQYTEQRAQRRLTQQRAFEKQQDRIQKEQAFIDRYRAGQRARQAQGREKRLERLVSDDLLDRPVHLDSMSLKLRAATRCSDIAIAAEDISKSYGELQLFRDLSMVVKRGDRIGIIGPNGAGKSTLIKALLGELPVDKGTTRVGGSVDVGYYRQSHDHLNLSLTIIDFLRQFVEGQKEQTARDLAGAFLFTGLEQDKPLSNLSGGERSRAALAGLMAKGHNLLVLDEPTNHLDIDSAERLEEALLQFTAQPTGWTDQQTGGGTLILISHDRMLLDRLATQLIVFDGHGHARLFLGTYSEFLRAQSAQGTAKPAGDKASSEKQAKKAEPTQRKAEPEGKPQPAPQHASRGEAQGSQPRKPGKQAPTAAGGAITKLSMQKLEQKMVELEKKLAEIDATLADPGVYRDGAKVRSLQQQREQLATELGPVEEEWLRRNGS